MQKDHLGAKNQDIKMHLIIRLYDHNNPKNSASCSIHDRGNSGLLLNLTFSVYGICGGGNLYENKRYNIRITK